MGKSGICSGTAGFCSAFVRLGLGDKRGDSCFSDRKNRVKKVMRVPAISNKIADIPADEFSWRKYGQKPIKGSPYPR